MKRTSKVAYVDLGADYYEEKFKSRIIHNLNPSSTVQNYFRSFSDESPRMERALGDSL
ncbi:MAG: hypothetical protein V1799_17460 [bacterium]